MRPLILCADKNKDIFDPQAKLTTPMVCVYVRTIHKWTHKLHSNLQAPLQHFWKIDSCGY